MEQSRKVKAERPKQIELPTENCQTDLGVSQSREKRERGGLFRATLRFGTNEILVLNPYNP
ncbi:MULTISPECIES: hypothetical protein [unclassified Pedobacter]|uniref:hypothetical protein n=1 Tax=unclassified Pedobacter TaxID=2628915 RepID=UPI001E553380|nr:MULTISPECIES: hypothetical protein [unclassified Pedobacter]